MPRLLNSMPFLADPGEIVVRDERVIVRANQLIMWVTLTLRRVDVPNPTATPFPVILDTGHTHSFSIHERHLRDWAGLRPEMLLELKAIRERRQRITLRAANIWAHPNERHSRERLASRPPILVEADAGIAVYPGNDFPRLPILGLRAIAYNQLVLEVSGAKRQATLRTANRWWPYA